MYKRFYFVYSSSYCYAICVADVGRLGWIMTARLGVKRFDVVLYIIRVIYALFHECEEKKVDENENRKRALEESENNDSTRA